VTKINRTKVVTWPPNTKYPSLLGLLCRVPNPLPLPRVPVTTLHPAKDSTNWASGGGHILELEGTQEMGILHIKEEISSKNSPKNVRKSI
jgi:hypothetical protein